MSVKEKQQGKRKRYYKVGEKVFIKELKKIGEIMNLIIDPTSDVYKAEVKYQDKNGAKVETFGLWEIDKNKRETFKNQRANNHEKPLVYFAKVRPTAIIPSKEDENAGYDIYADFEENDLIIFPHEVKMIPTGIASCVSDDWALIAKERGSTGTKGMVIQAGVVDSGYRGEIFIVITNATDKAIIISKSPETAEKHFDAVAYPKNKAIAQLILVPVPKATVKEIPYEELVNITSNRGTTKLGQSGK